MVNSRIQTKPQKLRLNKPKLLNNDSFGNVLVLLIKNDATAEMYYTIVRRINIDRLSCLKDVIGAP